MGKVYDELPQSIKEALIDLNYNKGLPKITGNKKLMKALKKGNYSEVVAELKYVHSGKSKAVKKKETEGNHFAAKKVVQERKEAVEKGFV